MEAVQFIVPKNLEPFINCIMVKESDDPDTAYKLPIYADGYPGIMFHQSENGFMLNPRGKQLSELFLFGQTLNPISIETTGKFRFVVFQLYPFASKYLLGIDPKVLNDDCYDLLPLQHVNVSHYKSALDGTIDLAEQVRIVSQLMLELIKSHNIPQDDIVQQAIHLIIQEEGQVSMKSVREDLYLTERTFERKFLDKVGLTPKQFARIIQFQTSLDQLNQAKYKKLVEVGLDSGFADQSHFIRTFKKYTGQTPSYYLKQKTGS